MLRKLSFGLLFVAAAINNTHAEEAVPVVKPQSITMEFILPPNEPQLFINYMFWTIDANCVMNTEDEGNELYVVAQAKKGKINDTPLAAGQSLKLTVQNNEILRINADSGAKVEITNLGSHTVKATCTA